MSSSRSKPCSVILEDVGYPEPRNKRKRKNQEESSSASSPVPRRTKQKNQEDNSSATARKQNDNSTREPQSLENTLQSIGDGPSCPATVKVEPVDPDHAEASGSESESDSDDAEEGESRPADLHSVQELDRFFKEEKLGDALHEFTELTKGDFMQEILFWCNRHEVSGRSLASVLRLFRKYMPNDNLVPIASIKFVQLEKMVLATSKESQAENFCNVCAEPLEEESCSKCSVEEVACSVSNDVGTTIQRFFECKFLAQEIDSYQEKCSENFSGNDYYDICCGNICKSIKDKAKYDIQLIMNVSSLAVSGHGPQRKLWTVLLAIANVDPVVRKEFLICAKMWFCPEKEPVVKDLLHEWVQSIALLKRNGVDWTCPITKKIFNSKVSVVALTSDAYTRAVIQNISCSGKDFGCNYCEIESKEVNGDRLYPFEEVNCKMVSRTTLRMMEQARECLSIKEKQAKAAANKKGDSSQTKSIEHVRGVKGYSELRNLPDFDIVNSFSPDHFESLLMGFVKEHIYIITSRDNKKEPFSIYDVNKEVSKSYSEVKAPAFLRKVKGLSSAQKWRQMETLFWLLYGSLPILKDAFKDEEYVQHWCLLVEAIHILNRDRVTIIMEEIFRANEMLRAFCRKYKTLYGASFESYNIHLLVHFSNSVINLGPLWSTSSLVFKDANLLLARVIKNYKDDEEFENVFDVLDSAISFQSAFDCYRRKERKSEVELLNTGKPAEFGLQNDIMYYEKVSVRGIVYTSEQYSKDNNMCSHFVLYKNEVTGTREAAKILNFTKLGDNISCYGRKVALSPVEEFFNSEFHFHVSHIHKMTETDELICFKADSIVKPLVAVEDYLCEPPNTIELLASN